MQRNTKIALGIVGCLVLGCAGLGALGAWGLHSAGDALVDSTTSDPAEVAAIADEIAAFDLPPGYTGRFGMAMMGIQMATFGGASTSSVQPALTLMEYPSSIANPEQMKQQMATSSGQRFDNASELESREMTVLGQTVTVVRSEATGDDGEQLLHEMCSFTTSDGMGMFMAVGPKETWNQAQIDGFLTSLR